MVVYPSALTAEEKSLKKRYARILDKRKQLRKTQEKPSLKPTSSAQSTEVLSPKDAMAAAKRMLEAGKLRLGKKTPLKKTGFKRVGETSSEAPPPKKPFSISLSNRDSSTAEQQHQEQRLKQKRVADQINYQKSLYKTTFVKGSTAADIERIPRRQEDADAAKPLSVSSKSLPLKDRTVCVCVKECTSNLTEEALKKAFERFGIVEKIEQRTSSKSAFVSYSRESCASVAVREMNRGMIRGQEVIVQHASEENGFVELSPEAANHPWVAIAAGKEATNQINPPQSRRTQQSYENLDF